MGSVTPLSLMSAALRHLQDAEHLASGCVCTSAAQSGPRPTARQHQSLDQAEHLIGFAPECARKACLSLRWLDQVISHDLSTAADELLDFAISVDAYAARYPIRSWTAGTELANWTPNIRYRPTARKAADVTELERRVAGLQREATTAVDEVLICLYVDGQLDPIGDL